MSPKAKPWEKHRKRPRKCSGVTELHFPKELHLAAAEWADQNRVSLNHLVSTIIARHVGWVEAATQSDRNFFSALRAFILSTPERRLERWNPAQQKMLAAGIDLFMKKRYGLYPRAKAMRPTQDEIQAAQEAERDEKRKSSVAGEAGAVDGEGGTQVVSGLHGSEGAQHPSPDVHGGDPA